MIVCCETAPGRVLSDVLEADWPEGWYWEHSGEGWYSTGDRYAFGNLDGPWCDHAHEIPTQEEIAAKVVEAKRTQRVIQLRVHAKR